MLVFRSILLFLHLYIYVINHMERMELTVLAFIASLFIRVIYSCPEKCYCDKYKKMTCDSVIFTAKDIRELVIPSSVSYVRLVDNQLEKISSDILQKFRNISSLEISRNNLKTIPADSFKEFRYLRNLNLKDNRIHTFTRDSFNGLRYLKHLNLHNNHITELRPGLFDKLPSIESLKLSSNKIQSIPNGVFTSLKHLRAVYLSNNKVTRIGNRAFQNMTMDKLGMSHNKLARIPTSTFKGFRISFKILLFFNPFICVCRDLMDYAVNLKHLRSKIWGYCNTPNNAKGKMLVSAYRDMECSMCDLRSCNNGGVCSGNASSFTCNCPERYKGKMCEISICKPRVKYITKYVHERGKSVIQFIKQKRINGSDSNVVRHKRNEEAEKKLLILYVMCSIEFIIIVCFVALFMWKRYQDKRLLKEYDHQKRKQILEKIKNTTNRKLQESLY